MRACAAPSLLRGQACGSCACSGRRRDANARMAHAHALHADGPPLNRFSNMRSQAVASEMMNNPIYEEAEPVHEHEEEAACAADVVDAVVGDAEPQPQAADAPAAAVPAALPPAAAESAAVESAAVPASPQAHERVQAQAPPLALNLDSLIGAAPVHSTSTDSDAGEWAVADADQLSWKSRGTPGSAVGPHTSTSAPGAASSPDGKAHAHSMFAYPSARAFGECVVAVAGSPELTKRASLGAVPAADAALRDCVPSLPVDNPVFDEHESLQMMQPVRPVAWGSESPGAHAIAWAKAARLRQPGGS